MLNDHVIKEIALSGGSKKNITKELKSYRLLNFKEKKVTQCRLWDTCGFHVK